MAQQIPQQITCDNHSDGLPIPGPQNAFRYHTLMILLPCDVKRPCCRWDQEDFLGHRLSEAAAVGMGGTWEIDFFI